jgi:hypothetical protein
VNRSRAQLLTRLASLERFREEWLRQELAVANTAALEAREQQERDGDVLRAMESIRTSAIQSSHADMARYALYSGCAEAAATYLERSMVASAEAGAEVERVSRLWTTQRARKDMADERAQKAGREVIEADEEREAIDTMELWLGRGAGV